MSTHLTAYEPGQVRLLPGLFQDRFQLNRRYLLDLDERALLQNHLIEARLLQASFLDSRGGPGYEDGWHWGWESPTCQVRGHFLGHWLSGAARRYASTGDPLLKGKIDHVVSELGRCWCNRDVSAARADDSHSWSIAPASRGVGIELTCRLCPPGESAKPTKCHPARPGAPVGAPTALVSPGRRCARYPWR